MHFIYTCTKVAENQYSSWLVYRTPALCSKSVVIVVVVLLASSSNFLSIINEALCAISYTPSRLHSTCSSPPAPVAPVKQNLKVRLLSCMSSYHHCIVCVCVCVCVAVGSLSVQPRRGRWRSLFCPCSTVLNVNACSERFGGLSLLSVCVSFLLTSTQMYLFTHLEALRGVKFREGHFSG